jgi:hypothetical protein
VAERIRKELGVEVDEVSGRYGEFTVLVDGEEIRRGNPLATSLAIMPPASEIVAAVKARLSG